MNKKDLIINCPINSLSFGNVSVNILREMFQKDLKVSLFPIGEPDVSVFDKLSKDFLSWLDLSMSSRFDGISKDTPSLKIWHLNGGENRISKNQFLYTFHEMDNVTPIEKSICKLQDTTIFSSSFSKSLFEGSGCDNVTNIPIGFDTDFFNTDKKYLQDKIVFGISGKFEKRKHTSKIIKLWIAKYGNKMDYRLHCLVNNPFLTQDKIQSEISEIIGDQPVHNVTFYTPQKNNSMMNNWLNSIDVDLSGLSGAEGWNLGAFNSTCLGKWSIVLNHTSHLDWANEENCVLVQPNGKESAVDGQFFTENSPFNQGNINTFDNNDVLRAFEVAESLAKKQNLKGLELGKSTTYEKTLDKILKVMDL